MLLLLLKESHTLLGLLRFEVLENLKERHKKNFYNRANKRKQKQTSQGRSLKRQKNQQKEKRKQQKIIISLPLARWRDISCLDWQWGFREGGLSTVQNIQTGF